MGTIKSISIPEKRRKTKKWITFAYTAKKQRELLNYLEIPI
jgi:hypothetical protein